MQNLLKDLSEEISKIDSTQKVSSIVKNIDKLVYEYYRKMYGLNDIKYNHNKTVETKKGHCC